MQLKLRSVPRYILKHVAFDSALSHFLLFISFILKVYLGFFLSFISFFFNILHHCKNTRSKRIVNFYGTGVCVWELFALTSIWQRQEARTRGYLMNSAVKYRGKFVKWWWDFIGTRLIYFSFDFVTSSGVIEYGYW